MYVLHANIGKHIPMIEKHLCDVVQEDCFQFRQRNVNARRYRKGPVIDHREYFLYIVVGRIVGTIVVKPPLMLEKQTRYYTVMFECTLSVYTRFDNIALRSHGMNA